LSRLPTDVTARYFLRKIQGGGTFTSEVNGVQGLETEDSIDLIV
jgi:hypothetical protein